MLSHKILKISQPCAIALQNSFAKELGISAILSQVLINRGIKSIAEAEKFLNIKISQLFDPNKFSDMPKAVSLIKKAASCKDKVMIFGDYDVDGITAVALLANTLRNLGLDTQHYLPHRVKEGYGLCKNILQVTRERKIKLLITVDCGISNHKEIEELRRNNIEVIITDHHEPSGAEIPRASAVLNPKVLGTNYPFRDLAGVGVAYKLCKALSGSMLLDDLDLVCLGTIADSVPLTGENRVIAKEGLRRLPQTKKAGLQILMENAGIKDKKFTSTYVSFILAPRLNASGRMDTAEVSLNLLLSASRQQAIGLAGIIEGHNRQRQKVESRVLEEAEALINQEINFKQQKIIVLAKEGWHHGVLGIVASKIADRFLRPAIVISLNDGLCKGSGRSINNFHLFEALLSCKQFLSGFGGHSHAVGLVITKDNIDGFKRSINKLAREKLTLEDLLPALDVDMELALSDLNEGLIAELERLEPFGKGNPEPLFFTRNLLLKGEVRSLGRQTLKFQVTDGKVVFQAIGFGMSSLRDSLLAAEKIDLVYFPRQDQWQGVSSLILEVKDIFFR
ncbi:MAG: single-stranded-DNA-specific exonuclease RecJ [Candidatus Omnitrophota bacterium]